jgi:phosphoribosylformimino-5-aminoimidazole carboxamide ribotide isomerase
MNLYPAIDLKDGQCVRLLRGEMDKATIFSDSPADQASLFEEQGFSWLHLVDLNGAFEGKPINKDAVTDILSRVNVPVQLGGGIRDMQMIETWLEAGISRVILGTIALHEPILVKEACSNFPGKICVGIDAKNGMVAVDGWAKVTKVSAVDLATRYEDCGVAAIIYTDISKDGAMQGPNVEETAALAEKLSTPIIASGGISHLDDIKKYKALTDKGIDGCILGRSLYEKAINPSEAIAVAKA